jgi:hypothetical protein
LVNRLLESEVERGKFAKRLFRKCFEHFEDEKIMAKVEGKISQNNGKEICEGPDNDGNLPYWYLKKVLRARIQLLWHRPNDIVDEILRVSRHSGRISIIAQGRIVIDTICWIIYHQAVSWRRS